MGSIPANGSSSNIYLGSDAKHLAISKRRLSPPDNDRDEVWTAQQMRALINYLDDNAELSTLGKIGRAKIRYSDIMGNT